MFPQVACAYRSLSSLVFFKYKSLEKKERRPVCICEEYGLLFITKFIWQFYLGLKKRTCIAKCKSIRSLMQITSAK